MLFLNSRRRFVISLTSIGPTIPQPSKGKKAAVPSPVYRMVGLFLK
jgi:hypothetical protein